MNFIATSEVIKPISASIADESATTALQIENMTLSQVPIRDLQYNPGITIAGKIVSVVGNEFILDDGTGQVIVDAGPRWYHQINVSAGESVTVTGEYDDGDFDAFTITRSTGEVIHIRPAEGPPPWAGGRRHQDD